MTVQTTANRVEYTANGVTTAFPVTFVFLSSSDIKVYIDGTLKTITTDYTVSGGSGSTGTITFLSPPDINAEIIILRDPTLTQLTDFRNQGGFFAEVHEQAFDKATMQIQRLNDRLSRAAILSDTVAGSVDSTLPAPSANRVIQWNADADALENGPSSTEITNAEANALSAAASAAAAAASYDAFDDRYLGSKTSDPTLDNDGAALLTGALYWNSLSNKLRIYNGAAWEDTATATPSSFTADTFSGTGAQTAFTLSATPANVQSCLVFISGVRQRPTADYTVSGTTLTFTSAPASGTNNITVLTVATLAAGVPDDDSVSTAKLQNSAVTTAKINDAAVTNDKLAASAKSVGKQTVWIPAGAMVARLTNGAAQGLAETTTNKIMLKTLDFDTTTAEYAQFSVLMPKGWNEGTITFKAAWTHGSTTTNFGVAWQLAGVALSNDDAADTAFGTAGTVTDTGGTTNDIYLTDESSAITIGGTPAEGDYVIFQINRAPSNGSDTMAVDAKLLGVHLYYTLDAANDA